MVLDSRCCRMELNAATRDFSARISSFLLSARASIWLTCPGLHLDASLPWADASVTISGTGLSDLYVPPKAKHLFPCSLFLLPQETPSSVPRFLRRRVININANMTIARKRAEPAAAPMIAIR